MTGIPDKLYFKIGEVCRLANVKPHVLRYWEAEFAIIRPQRATSKQRLYRRVDVENILAIRDLLYEQGFTIAGAKKAMAERRKEAEDSGPGQPVPPEVEMPESVEMVRGIKAELRSLKKLLEE